MILRSKSAKTGSMPNMALPLGEVVPMPCVLRNRSTKSVQFGQEVDEVRKA
jgi:hypothetical protein